MSIKSKAKALIGRALPTDTYEKLLEYSIACEPELSLDRSTEVRTPGSSWTDVVERGREEVWRRALEQIGSKDILYVEFGVWKGASISYFSQLNRSPRSLFYGFDSFEGLPEDWRGMKAGYFGTDGSMPEIDDRRVQFVKGWFRDTLPPRLDQLAQEARDRALLVHFDADLYSSTLFVLATLARRFASYHCIFDEFSGHELRALHNFMQAFGGRCTFHHHLMWHGDPMIVHATLQIPPAVSAGEGVRMDKIDTGARRARSSPA